MGSQTGFVYVNDNKVNEYKSTLMFSDSSLPHNNNVTYNKAIAFLGSTGQIATNGNLYGCSQLITFDIKNDLLHCTFSNNDTSIQYGKAYNNTITVDADYDIISIQITMGGIDITTTAYKDDTISINKVTGNIYITGVVSSDDFSVTQNIDNCTTTNTTKYVLKNDPFTTKITANDGYEIKSATILMGTDDITSSVYDDGAINIAAVTDNIIITVIAQVITYTVTEGICDGVTVVTDSTIEYGKTLTINVTVNDKYILDANNISITENNVEKAFTYSNNTIIIENVKGNIIYNIDAIAIYSITYVLNNIKSSNEATEITDQETYTSTLSFTSSEYEEADVTIIMGDADVTLASYDETSMTITIQKPSGDIVINAEAIGSAIKKNYETKIDLTSISWKFNKLRDESTETFDTTMMASDYDDSSWTSITLPYDWSVYNSFDSTISGNEYESGWLAGGDAIYRAKVTIPSDYNGNKIYIHFDGVYMTSEIYINGTSVGTNKNGYIPFNFDITEYVTYGAENTIAVAVSNHLPSSRWYSGSGIYRNCWISMVNVPELGIEDITITSPNLATEHTGTVETDVKFDIESISSNDITLSEIKACIYQDWNNVLVGYQILSNQTLKANSTNSFTIAVGVTSPTLWATHDISDTIRVYKTIVSIKYTKDNVQYTVTSNSEIFGYRYISYDSEGFYLNGSKVFLKGMCLHHDNGILGSETYKDATERELRILKQAGCNCLRTTHAPQSSIFLDLAMRQGFMVIEELFDGWRYSKNNNTYDYARFFNEDNQYIEIVPKNVINRDKNNPAIIMWSIGNEVDEGCTVSLNDQYVTDASTIIAYVKKYDTTRPTTIGNQKPTDSTAQKICTLVDIVGINYGDDSEYSSLRSATSEGVAFSSKCIYGSETTSALYTRGIYTVNTSNQYFSCFDTTNTEQANSHVSWGDAGCVALKRHTTTYSWLAGLMSWTGFDYIGEPTPINSNKSRSSFFGIVDLVGLKKDPYYMYQSLWTTTPMIHIVPEDWTSYTEGEQVTVWVYSNCSSVKLHLNGVEMTATNTPDTGIHYAYEYTITYSKNPLVATGYDTDENIIAQDVRYAAGTPYQIGLYSDKSLLSKTGLLYVECNIEDENDIIVPTANNKVLFTCTNGEILGTDNGFPGCLEDLRNSEQTCFSGKCVVIVKPNAEMSKVIITATSDGLTNGEFSIKLADENTYVTPESEYIDPLNPPTNPKLLYYTLSNNNVHLENGGSETITITKYLKNAKDYINLVSAPDGISVEIDNNFNTVTLLNTIDDIKGEVIIECGGIERTINVTSGSYESITCTMKLDNIEDASTIYELEYLPISFTSSDGTISSINVIYGNNSVSYDPDTTQIYGATLGLGIIEVKLSTNDVYYFYITVNKWYDSTQNTISTDKIESAYSEEYQITKTSHVVDQTINGEIELLLDNSSSASYIGIIDIDPTATMITTPIATFGYDKTGTRKSYLLKWNVPQGGYLGTEVSIQNSENGVYTLNIRSYNTSTIFTYRIGTLSCTDIILDTTSITITSDETNNQQIGYTLVPANTTDNISFTSANSNVMLSGNNIFAIKNGEDIITATCGTISKTISVTISGITEDETILVQNYNVNSQKIYYSNGETGIAWDSTYTLYVALRVDDTTTPTQNVISVGNNIANWTGIHWHMYYPYNSEYIRIAMGASSYVTQTNLTNTMKGDDANIIYIVQNTNGLWINGSDATNIISDTITSISELSNLQIGSVEGTSRFAGTILELRRIKLTDLVDTYSTSGLSSTELEEISNNGLDKSKYLKIYKEITNTAADNESTSANAINIAFDMGNENNLATANSLLYALPVSYEYLTNLSINSSIDILLANPHINNGYILGHLNNKTIGYSNDQVSTTAGYGFDSIYTIDDQMYVLLNGEYFNNFVYTLTKTNDNTYTIVLKDTYSPIGESGLISWDTTPIEYTIDSNISSTMSLSDGYDLDYCIRFKNPVGYYLSAQGSPSLAKFTLNNSEWSTWYVYKVN